MKEAIKRNPFSGVAAENIEDVIVPRFDFEAVLQKIRSLEPMAIELSGRRGRGKTTHLVYLHQHLVSYPIVRLKPKAKLSEILDTHSEVLFVDGIYNLNFIDRIKLFKECRLIVYTTHQTCALECFVANKKLHRLKLKGIDGALLQNIVGKRLSLASNRYQTFEGLKPNEIDALIKTFGDNYRAIINHLFDRYQ